jgi:hypothetical protein
MCHEVVATWALQSSSPPEQVIHLSELKINFTERPCCCCCSHCCCGLQEVACPLAFSTMGTTAYTILVTQVGLFQVKGDPRPTEVVQLSLSHLNARLPLLPKDPPKGKGTCVQARSSCVAEVRGVPLPSAAAQASMRMLPALRSKTSSMDGSSTGGGGATGIAKLRAASFAAVAFGSLRRSSPPPAAVAGAFAPSRSLGVNRSSSPGDPIIAVSQRGLGLSGSSDAAAAGGVQLSSLAAAGGRLPVAPAGGLTQSLRSRGDSACAPSGHSTLGGPPSRTHSLPAWLGGASAAGGSGGAMGGRPSLRELSQPPMMSPDEGEEDDMV